MAKTYDEINAGAKQLRQKILNQGKKGIVSRTYTWMTKSFSGKALYSAAMVGTLVAVAEYHGAVNSKNVQDSVDYTTNRISSVLEQNKATIKDFVGRMSSSNEAQDIENNIDHVGKMLYSKKQAYENVLKKEPDNKEAVLGLQKLEDIISNYEQNINQND